MLALFLGSSSAMFIALLAGDYVARGRQSLFHALALGANSALKGLLLIAIIAIAPMTLFYLLIAFVRTVL